MQYKWITVLVSVLLCWGSVSYAAEPTPVKPENEPLVQFARDVIKLSGDLSVTGAPLAKPLLDKLAQAFTTKNADVKFDIKESDTPATLAAIKDGSAKLGVITRELYDTEITAFPEVKSYTITGNGIAVIVNPSCPVAKLTMAQIKDIFSGKIVKWKPLGGEDKPINLVMLPENTDIRTMFEQIVGAGEGILKPPKTAVVKETLEALRGTVASTPDTIGYLPFPLVDTGVKAVTINDVEPTVANVSSNAYPLVYPINVISKDIPEEIARMWVLFILGPDGQDLVAKENHMRVD